MGTVTSLDEHRRRRRGGGAAGRALAAPATLAFDLASPYTYLVAERADRLFPRLQWLPAASEMIEPEPRSEAALVAAGARAEQLGMPFVWPDELSCGGRGAMRVASLAADLGRGGSFVLAAARLAFCGGFDIDDPELLAEAAAAAGIELRVALDAAGDVSRDGRLEEAGRTLLAAGATRLPALRVGRLLFCGEDRLLEAAAARTAV